MKNIKKLILLWSLVFTPFLSKAACTDMYVFISDDVYCCQTTVLCSHSPSSHYRSIVYDGNCPIVSGDYGDSPEFFSLGFYQNHNISDPNWADDVIRVATFCKTYGETIGTIITYRISNQGTYYSQAAVNVIATSPGSQGCQDFTVYPGTWNESGDPCSTNRPSNPPGCSYGPPTPSYCGCSIGGDDLMAATVGYEYIDLDEYFASRPYLKEKLDRWVKEEVRKLRKNN